MPCSIDTMRWDRGGKQGWPSRRATSTMRKHRLLLRRPLTSFLYFIVAVSAQLDRFVPPNNHPSCNSPPVSLPSRALPCIRHVTRAEAVRPCAAQHPRLPPTRRRGLCSHHVQSLDGRLQSRRSSSALEAPCGPTSRAPLFVASALPGRPPLTVQDNPICRGLVQFIRRLEGKAKKHNLHQLCEQWGGHADQ